MKYIWPSKNHALNCGFYGYENHNAADLNAVLEPVWASRAGTVVFLTHDISGKAGRYIEVDHEDGWRTRYLHLSRIDVVIGQQVAQGEQIAISGGSGLGSESGYGKHLHFALWAPSEAEALTIWGDPRLVDWASPQMWAVDPVTALDDPEFNQKEEHELDAQEREWLKETWGGARELQSVGQKFVLAQVAQMLAEIFEAGAVASRDSTVERARADKAKALARQWNAAQDAEEKAVQPFFNPTRKWVGQEPK